MNSVANRFVKSLVWDKKPFTIRFCMVMWRRILGFSSLNCNMWNRPSTRLLHANHLSKTHDNRGQSVYCGLYRWQKRLLIRYGEWSDVFCGKNRYFNKTKPEALEIWREGKCKGYSGRIQNQWRSILTFNNKERTQHYNTETKTDQLNIRSDLGSCGAFENNILWYC